MADPLGYTLEVGGVSEDEAEEIAGALIGSGAASPPDRTMGFALDGRYDYGRGEATAYFWKSDETTWPDAEGELRGLSGRYPRALFVLDASGFEEETIRAYFKGGRSYAVSPEIVYPPFDEARLA